MKRIIHKSLLAWKQQPHRLPLLLRGARQVGKSFAVRQFAKEAFTDCVEINFEQFPHYQSCFQSLSTRTILLQLEALTNRSITPGQTLLFLDEIQECPQAIMALRYFKEECPELHVIGAGSLLEFALEAEDFSMPVGRVQFLQMQPLSFQEFLTALGKDKLVAFLQQVTVASGIPEAIHHELLALLKQYAMIGGMPAVVQAYLEGQSLKICQDLQTALLQTYRADFGKYAKAPEHRYLQALFMKLPRLVAEQFKYSKVMLDARANDIKNALAKLVLAGLVYRVHASPASGLPLSALINEKKFKTLFVDIGLLMRAGELPLKMLMEESLDLVHQGALMEQLVGQELLAYQDPTLDHALYFWSREAKSSTAEVDYLITLGHHIVPLEVKSKSAGHLKSLHLLMQEKSLPLGVKISQAPLAQSGNLLSVPAYLLAELPRLCLMI